MNRPGSGSIAWPTEGQQQLVTGYEAHPATYLEPWAGDDIWSEDDAWHALTASPSVDGWRSGDGGATGRGEVGQW